LSRVNTFVIIFIAFISIILGGVWFAVHSQEFAKFVSKQITRAVSKNKSTTILFSHLEVGLFPPATILKNVRLEVDDKDIGNVTVESGNLELKFSLLNFMTSNLKLNELKIDDGIIKYKSNNKRTEKKNLEYRNAYQDIRSALKNKLPFQIQNILISRTQLLVDGKGFNIENAGVNIYKSLLEVSGNIYSNELTPEVPFLYGANIDELAFKVQMTKDKAWVKDFSVSSDTEKFSYTGEVDFGGSEIALKGESDFKGSLKSLVKKVDVPDILKGTSGYVNLESKIDGSINNPSIRFKLSANDLHSAFVFTKNIEATGEVKDLIFSLDKLVVKGQKEKSDARLLNKVELFSLKDKKFLNNKARMSLRDIHTNQALFAIDDILNTFKGEISGEVDVWWSGEDVTFEMQEGLTLNNFKLLASRDSKDVAILQNDKIRFSKGQIKILQDFHVGFDVKIDQEKTKLKVDGLITDKDLSFESNGGTLDLKELGPIAGVEIKGAGRVDINIFGQFEDVRFEFKTDVKDFKVVDISLGQLKSKLELDLNNLLLNIPSAEGEFRNTKYKAKGFIDFLKLDIDIDGEMIKSTYQDNLIIFKDLLDQLPYYPKDIFGNVESTFKVAGKLEEDGLKIFGKVKGSDLRFLDEDFESLSLDFSYVSSSLDISKIDLAKGNGHLNGQFLYNEKSGYFEYDSRVIGLNLDDINILRLAKLGITGEIFGEFYGNGTASDFSTRSHLRLIKTLVGNERLNDSILTVFNNSKNLFVSGNLLGDRGKFNMFFNLDKEKDQNSYANLYFNVDDPHVMFGILSQHNVVDRELKGKVSGSFKTTFSIFDFNKLGLDLIFREFNFSKGPMRLSLVKNKNYIKIEDGVVNNWDIQFSGGKDKAVSKASGNVKDGINIEQKINLNSKAIEFLTPFIARSAGRIKARNTINLSSKNIDNSLQIESSNMSMKLKGVPGVITNIKFKTLLDGKDLFIDNFSADFGKGDIKAKGLVRLAIPYPNADLSIDVNESNIPFFKKSGVVISANTRVHGKKFPYFLDGQVRLVGGEILDDIKDIVGKKASVATYSKYIPLSTFEKKVEYVNLNLDVDFIQPLRVKNNFADLQFLGEGKVRGILSNPVINGKMDVTPGISKFLFKGHEFVIKDGNIRVFGDESLNPSLNFIALTNVDKYEIKLSVGGTADQLSINLESEPFLSKEDILSLLTLGYTADISKNLEEKDRQSVTTIGLGTLIVDQLRLNEGLNSSLGLKLSVLPEFSENEASLLQGKSAVLDSSASRLKSATKVKLQKKISKKVDLSVSSTVGGSLEQKQEMNLNYNINNNLSIEGVYEVRSTTEEESTQDPESVGADVKYKWTF